MEIIAWEGGLRRREAPVWGAVERSPSLLSKEEGLSCRGEGLITEEEAV